MATAPTGKYHLRSIHEEIALFDRKIAHLEKYETFGSEEEREQAARKMATKRKSLVTIAQRLVAEGVEFDASDLPKSLRPAGSEAAPPATAPTPKKAPAEAPVAAPPRGQDASPYAGTSLDWQASVERYLAKKKRK
ncbi:MAG TPA: hypothetical protein VMD97_00980 [Candidatus Aquilonibacter sp.]|nr:hypothetical protein [Candidatus Aquilonibacter sp.]